MGHMNISVTNLTDQEPLSKCKHNSNFQINALKSLVRRVNISLGNLG